MKYTYQFADETVAIEVGEEWVTILKEEDRREFNNDHAQTRRHCSLEDYNLDDCLLPSDTDVEGDVVARLDGTIEDERRGRLCRAISMLTPEQQDLAFRVLMGGMKRYKYAEEKGISAMAVTKRIDTISKKIKKFF